MLNGASREHFRTILVAIRLVADGDTYGHHASNFKQEENMAAPEKMYQCQVSNCGWIYDPDKGDAKGNVKAGVAFKDVPDTWVCPSCGATKKSFRPLAGPGSVVAEGI